MDDFTTLSTPSRLGDDRFRWEVPEGWRQGRGAFGGLVIAALVRAGEMAAESPERRVRNVAAQLVGPVMAGPAEIEVTRLRVGSGVTSLSAVLRQGDGIAAQASLVLAKERSRDLDAVDLAPPELPPWEAIPPLPVAPPLGPEFAVNFEFRATGHFPFSGASQPSSGGYLCALRPGKARDAAYVAALADGYWPAILARLTQPRPTATVSYNLQIVADPRELDPALPLFHRGRALASADGYIAEHRELWSIDGNLVALNQQTFAVIR